MRQAYNVGNAHSAAVGGAGPDFGSASREFDGNDYIGIASPGNSYTEATIFVRLKTSTKPGSFGGLFYSGYGGGNGVTYLGLVMDSSGRIRGDMDNGWSLNLVYSNDVADGDWHSVALVMRITGANIIGDLYIDGAYANSTPIPRAASTFTSTAEWQFGRLTKYYFTGNLADGRFYSRAISTIEIADLAAGTDIDSTGLEGWWLLNDDDVLDYSGNGNDGTNYGSTYSTDGPLD